MVPCGRSKYFDYNFMIYTVEKKVLPTISVLFDVFSSVLTFCNYCAVIFMIIVIMMYVQITW